MAIPVLLPREIDPLGTSVDNRVIDEPHRLGKVLRNVVVPKLGPYYVDSLVVKDANNRVLKKNESYVIAELYTQPSLQYGKQIAQIIVINDPHITDDISISYQALGGPYQTNIDGIVQLVNNILKSELPVNWINVLNKPSSFIPAEHLHNIGDVYGWEYLVYAIEGLRHVIEYGDISKFQIILNEIEDDFVKKKDLFDKNGFIKADKIKISAERKNTIVNKKDGLYSNPQNYRLDVNKRVWLNDKFAANCKFPGDFVNGSENKPTLIYGSRHAIMGQPMIDYYIETPYGTTFSIPGYSKNNSVAGKLKLQTSESTFITTVLIGGNSHYMGAPSKWLELDNVYIPLYMSSGDDHTKISDSIINGSISIFDHYDIKSVGDEHPSMTDESLVTKVFIGDRKVALGTPDYFTLIVIENVKYYIPTYKVGGVSGCCSI